MPIKVPVPQVTTTNVEKNLDVAVLGIHLDEPSPVVSIRVRGKDAQGRWTGEVVEVRIQDDPSKQGFGANKATNLSKIILASRLPTTASVTTLLTRLGLVAPVTVEAFLDAMVQKHEQLTAEDNP